MPITEIEKVEECKFRITFDYDEDKITQEADAIAYDIGKNHALPGFRKGKAPVDAVKTIARKHVLNATKNKLMNDAFEDILHEKKWRPFGQPQVEEANLTYKKFSLKIVLAHAPEIKDAVFFVLLFFIITICFNK